MKILRLDLQAFGPFTDVSLDLSAGDPGLHVIYGPNEAGKSSALRALRQLFYGIPVNSTDNFVHPFPKLRIGAELLRSDGGRLEILRRKGAKNTLLRADGETPLDEAELKALLGGVGHDQFGTMFGIGHDSLVAGGKEIVRGGGEIGQTLFAAGAGIADVRTIRERLDKEADALFVPRGSKPAINRGLSALRDARKQVRDAQLRPTEWEKHKRELGEAERRLKEVEEKLKAASRQQSLFERIQQALPVMAKREDLRRELAELGDVRVLADDFSETRRDVSTQLSMATKTEQTAREAAEQLAGRIESLDVPERLIAQADAVEAIRNALSVYRKAQGDLPGLEAERGQLQKNAAAILRELRPDLTLGAADSLRLPQSQRDEILRLGNRQEALTKQFQLARAEIDDLQRQREQCREQVAALEVPRDGRPLKDAVRRTQSRGDLDGQLAAAVAELQAAEQQTAVDLQKLALWSGSLEDLETLCVPAAETVDRFEQTLADARRRADHLDEQLEKAQAEARETEQAIERLQRDGEVPTEEELAEARRIRDLGWRLVQDAWQKRTADPANEDEFRRFFDPSLGLAEAFEQAIRRVDDLADRLFREANRVATLRGLEADRDSHQRQAAQLAEQSTLARHAHREIEKKWEDAWRPAGFLPLPPREMRGWLTRQQKLIERAQAIRTGRTGVQELEDAMAACRDELRRNLSDVGETVDNAEESLAALVARCEATVEQIDTDAATRRQLESDLSSTTQRLADAEAAAEKAEAELAAWHGQWVAAVEPLGLTGDAAPETAQKIVTGTDKLLGQLQQAENVTQRIEAIGRDNGRFEEDVRRVVGRVDPELASLPPEEAADELIARLDRATRDRDRQEDGAADLKRHRETQQQARQTIDEMTSRLEVLCADAGCADPDDLPEVERISAKATELDKSLADCDERLRLLSGGIAVDAFIADVETANTDELPGQLEALGEQIEHLEAEKGELRERVGREKTELEKMDTTAAAADAAEEAEELVARIESDSQQYARLRLATALLGEAVERYRAKSQGPVVDRAAALLRLLTLGSFADLRVDTDDRGENVLAGVRPDGTVVAPAAMSEGTGDQLYLALRLASLEVWLKQNEPIPLILDDVLISFDDDRAAAALGVLAELSQQTQIIFFSHHRHLVDLAERNAADGLLFVHDL